MKKFPLMIVALWAGLASASAAQKPNILLILADDLGYGDVRCYNDQSKVATPHLDRLAREGMRFTDAHSPATVCTPTRYSLMTGQMAFRVPNGGTVFQGAGGPSLIAPGRLTLPAMLKAQGYAVHLVTDSRAERFAGTFPADEIHVEMASREFAEIELISQIAKRMDVAVGIVDVKSYYIETAEDIANRVRLCLKHAPADRLVFAPDCGLSQAARWAAKRKLASMVEGVGIVRKELGLS